MSQNPHLPAPADDAWSRFTANPRVQPAVRASDADREVAAQALNAAFAEGRLDRVEHTDRLTVALGAKQLGELVPLLDDITISTRPRPATPADRAHKVQQGAIRSWLALATLFNVIWAERLFWGGASSYYWPIWPMIGTAIPALITWIAVGAQGSAAAEDHHAARHQRHLERQERRHRG